jgi:hypothetical protein
MSKRKGGPVDQTEAVRGYNCSCGEAKCKELSESISLLAPDRGGFEKLPSMPNKDASPGEKRVHPKRQIAKERKGAVRSRWLKNLGAAVKDAATKLKQVFIARIHFRSEVTAKAPRTGASDGLSLMSLTISSELGKQLGYTDADLSPANDGTYLPVPNMTYAQAHQEYQELKLSAQAALGTLASPSPAPPPSSARPTPSPATPAAPSDAAVRLQLRASLSPLDPVAELAKVQRANATLNAEVIALKGELAIAHSKLDKADSERIQFLAFLTVSGGLNRLNITSDAWHALNPKAANHLFGFKNWHETVVHMRNFWPDVKRPDSASLRPETHMTEYEKLLITKMRFQRAMEEQMLALIWGRTQQSINLYVQECSPKWGQMGRFLSILDLNEEYLDAEIPEVFKELGLGKVGAMPDGKDFATDTPRGDSTMSKASYSDKIHHSGARCITWTTPAGLCFEHTILYMARASETSLVAEWRECLAKIPTGRTVLADRGFAKDAFLYPNFNVHLTPSFLAGREQFTSDEVQQDRRKCEVRYTSETAFSRVTYTTGLRDSIPRSLFAIMDDMSDWGHAYVNLCAPMQMPSGAPAGYFDNEEAKVKKLESKRKRREEVKKQKKRRKGSRRSAAAVADVAPPAAAAAAGES